MTEKPHDQLDPYLDGELDPAARRSFDDLVRRQPRLAESVELQKRIDLALRRQFGEPRPTSLRQVLDAIDRHAASLKTAAEGLAAPDENESDAASNTRLSLWARRLSIAAMLAVIAGGFWSAWNWWQSNRIEAPDRFVWTAASYHRAKASDGMKPYWLCESPEQFQQTFEQRLGQPLALKPMPEEGGVRCTGIDYVDLITPKTVAVLIYDHETPIVVFIDTAEAAAAHPLSLTTCSGEQSLHLFSRTIGSLTLHEITPNDHSTALDFFADPTQAGGDVQKTWKK